MAELRGLLESEAHFEVDIDMLDFSYVENCNDWTTLSKILRSLQTGQHGFYSELTQATEAKMLKVMPSIERNKYLALRQVVSPREIADAEDELISWEKSAKKIDHELIKKEVVSANLEDCSFFEVILNKSQLKKIRESAHDFKVQTLSRIQREKKAEMERRKGNEHFKSHDFSEAISCYTKSIAIYPFVDSTWSNRAIAYIKKELFDLAEQDCSAALKINPQSVKGLTRRGLARLSQGKYKEAAFDFQAALQIQPDSKELNNLLDQALSKYEDTEGTTLLLNGNIPTVLLSQAREDRSASVTIQFTENVCDLILPADEFVSVTRSQLLTAIQCTTSPPIALDQSFVRIPISEEEEEEEDKEDVVSPSSVAIRNGGNEQTEETTQSPAVRALQLKELGNERMKGGNFSGALDSYNSSLAAQHSILVYNNRALTHLNLKNFQSAVDDCSMVLREDPSNVKALFRRARGFKGLGLYEQAKKDVAKVLRFEAGNATALALSKELDELILSHPLKSEKSPNRPERTRAPTQNVPSTPPRTFFEFERCWRGLRSINQRLIYLQLFKKSTFKTVFKEVMNDELISSIIDCILDESCPATIARDVTVALCSNKLLVAMLCADDLNKLKTVAQRLQSQSLDKNCEVTKDAIALIVGTP